MSKKHQKSFHNDEQDQWVMVLPEQGCMFLFSSDNKKIFEVLKFNEEYRSWFIGNSVQSDGSLYIPSPVEPMFLALPYLINSAKSGKFMTLEQIIEDSEFPECHRLCSCQGLAKIGQVCEVKDDLLRFAHGIISEYLPVSLSKELQDYLGIKEEVIHEKPDITEPKAKKMKADLTPVEDYCKQNGQKDDKPKMTKLSVAQKKLEKVDKKGMKNISSFFATKNKK
ncbi:hypothetical protein LSH36_233g01010 [Paralvinella palmiformis]|uniref:Rnh202 triple barrel domain-containing protein n=1 Tax=Paralvinella palmiformis TaxID=53620 RepID=A0AAD9JM96_9ANNE|nr:hypothetical protein LSH36_233g01010 [Paralvinella palmiformis]